ncbi:MULTISPECIES: molybdopterin-binding protein [Protofrankia]|uniref:Adenylate kinase n=1 Tax=Protofrankia coriariae TaxID=1562887 RepID=A0ABR5F3S6_9ACTN|nr:MULTISPECIES: TOBE domain-containing protein [Protofrankia]KLL11363.1 adenylate kinase [Protofrankia coriariae]ONH34376.1 adenylate kinase [Protofrankia sp. BMG5.30]
MSISIRNQLSGTVTEITSGEAISAVKIRLAAGQEVVAAVTTEAVRELGITNGAQVQILVKATEVSLAVGEVSGLSIRNQIPGTITAIDQGGAIAIVKVAVEGGETITSAITKAAVGDLGLAAGSAVTVLIKSTEISIAAP